ncbi:MAG: hypothetical protein EBS79_08415 [Gammaproteobacteria bacterium]|nr:hypothetical protein [Gammaproteobacteria bacterium]
MTGGPLYLSELDPTWNNEELANITTLEIALVANPIALAACAADADSSITGIPFAALHDGTNYLVESYATSYLHGASEKPPKIHWPAQVFALGNGRPQGAMRGLPWVEEELTSITTPDRQGIW